MLVDGWKFDDKSGLEMVKLSELGVRARNFCRACDVSWGSVVRGREHSRFVR